MVAMALKNIWLGLDVHNLEGYTLIVPSVAVGNVGQLASDLLISSLRMEKIASVYSPAIIPVLGYDPYDLSSNKLSSSCEVYKSQVNALIVMQIRAPVVCKYAKSFLEDVLKTFKAKGLRNIVVLTSSFAHEKKHIQTSQFRYLANDLCPLKDNAQSLLWSLHTQEDEGLKIFGGGFATLLYKIAGELSVPCLVLYKYCSEGDNIPDAYDMVGQLSTILPLFRNEVDVQTQLVQPVSWKLLFGRPAPQDIY